MSTLGRLLITCFGLGHLRPAPGTWGSLPPVMLMLMLVMGLGNRGGHWSNELIVNGAMIAVIAVFSIACIRFGALAEAHFGRKDPGQVVADEVAGQCVAMLALPWQWSTDVRGIQTNVLLAAAAFILFRALDILKPPPANGLQRLGGGWGILIDDLVVGVYASVIIQIAGRWLLSR